MTQQQAPAAYPGLDPETAAALRMSADDIVARAPVPLTLFDDNAQMIAALARAILDDYAAALSAGRERVLMIVPVGPVGQYDLVAEACNGGGPSLDRLTLVLMDEYLTLDGAWIPESDPLSFRRHVREHLTERLPADRRPEVVVPHPDVPGRIATTIDDLGGVDVCYAGVGITGHLAFNDPVPGRADPEWFASLGTRVVALSAETRLINAVTAARGNVARVPHLAVTVGMKDILGARKLRIFMNRDWQCAAIRRLLFGPVTGAFPSSLAQRHDDLSLHVVRNVLDPPEPGLR